MAANSRDLVVNLLAKTDGMLGPLARLGSFMRSPAGLAGIVGGGAIAAGAGLLKLGESFDEAFDAIRVNTGATGGELEGLQDSFKDVFASVPTDMDTAAEAISGLNQRLHLTGDPLEDLATQFINLSRITGTDLTSSIDSATRLFGDWGISAGDMTGAMDEVFRASQASGVGVDSLASSMVQFGGPLRQMGFGFEESLAMFAKFEAEGVNTELVMGSMRIALGKMARAGEDAPETFRRVTDEIAAMEDPTQATALAIELFGARAGPDMAAAIREGRFEIDDYLATIEGGSDTINGAASATDDWRQKLQVFGNRMMVALEPLATRLLDGLGAAFERLGPVIESFAGFLDDVFGGDWEAVKKALGDFMNAALPIAADALKGIGDLLLDAGKKLLDGLWQGMQSVWDSTVLPFIKSLPGKALEGLGALGGFLLDKGRQLLSGLWQGIQNVWDDTVLPWLEGLPDKALDAVPALLKTLFSRGKQLLNGLREGVVEVWNSTLKPWLVDFANKALLAVPALLKTLFSRGKQLLNGLREGVVDVWNNTLKPWLADFANKALLAVPALFQTLFSRGKQLLNGLREGVFEVWTNTVRPWLVGIPGRVVSAVGSLLGTLDAHGKNLMVGLINGVVSKWNSKVSGWLSGTGSRILGAVGSLTSTLYNAGRDVLTGLWDGMKSIWDDVSNWLGGIGGVISDIKGPPEYDAKILVNNGELIMQGLREGLIAGWQETESLLRDMTASIPSNVDVRGITQVEHLGSASFDGALGGGGDVFNVTVHMPPGSNGEDVLRALLEVQRRRGPLPLKVRAA